MQSPSRPGSKYWLDGFPELVHQWDAIRNGDLTPADLSAGSGRRVWWSCAAGPDHHWRAKPNNRTRGAGCPFCANRRVSVTNNLMVRFPAIAAEWDPELNGALTPAGVVATSSRVAFWRCTRDPAHAWRASIRDRTRDLSSCPYCSNDRVGASNGLSVTHPLVALEWHPTRNAPLSAGSVTSGSSKRVWWKCGPCGHEWQATVANRVLRASRCPACAGRARVEPSPVFQRKAKS